MSNTPIGYVDYNGQPVTIYRYAKLTGQCYHTVYFRWLKGQPLDSPSPRGRPKGVKDLKRRASKNRNLYSLKINSANGKE